MFSKVYVLLLALGLSQAHPQMHLPDVGLMQFMIQSRDLNQDSPARSLSCFDYYLPLLNDAAENYKAEYAQCLTTAEDSREAIDDTTQDDRNQIDGSATTACEALSTCSQITSSVSYFECYTKAASENTKTMYTISADSSELLAQVREQYRLIEITQYECTNKTERTYVENTANTYEELNKCLTGVSPVPNGSTPQTPTTAPTDAPETSAPTAAPETSAPTAAPETSAPTAAPETSAPTAAPETSAPTAAPETSAPTAAPETSAPTDAPETSAPTAAPETSAPTDAPETSAPTAEPTTEDDSQKENFPEEDLSRAAVEQTQIKSMMDDIKKWLKRH
ncbi:hypothetical protein ACLKA7_014498 [Drosophila subpalustris]